MVCDRQLLTKHGLHMNVEGKEVMISKLLDILPAIIDRYKASKLIPLMWKIITVFCCQNFNFMLLMAKQNYGLNHTLITDI